MIRAARVVPRASRSAGRRFVSEQVRKQQESYAHRNPNLPVNLWGKGAVVRNALATAGAAFCLLSVGRISFDMTFGNNRRE